MHISKKNKNTQTQKKNTLICKGGKKKEKQKEKKVKLFNQPQPKSQTSSCLYKNKGFVFILLDNNILWEKYKSKQSDDVVKRKKIAWEFILFIIDNKKQGFSLKKTFSEEHSY